MDKDLTLLGKPLFKIGFVPFQAVGFACPGQVRHRTNPRIHSRNHGEKQWPAEFTAGVSQVHVGLFSKSAEIHRFDLNRGVAGFHAGGQRHALQFHLRGFACPPVAKFVHRSNGVGFGFRIERKPAVLCIA